MTVTKTGLGDEQYTSTVERRGRWYWVSTVRNMFAKETIIFPGGQGSDTATSWLEVWAERGFDGKDPAERHAEIVGQLVAGLLDEELGCDDE